MHKKYRQHISTNISISNAKKQNETYLYLFIWSKLGRGWTTPFLAQLSFAKNIHDQWHNKQFNEVMKMEISSIILRTNLKLKRKDMEIQNLSKTIWIHYTNYIFWILCNSYGIHYACLRCLMLNKRLNVWYQNKCMK